MVNLVQRGQNLGKESFLYELTNCKIHVFTTLLKGFYLSFVNIFFKNNPYLLNSMKGPLLWVPFLLCILFDFKAACI